MINLRLFASAIAVALGFIAAAPSAQAQSPLGAPLFAVLNGGNECNNVALPNGPDCRKGDLDGIGSATIIFPTTTSVCWAITADNLVGATLAHIHSGISGVNGGIVINLTPPSAPAAANPGASSGCAAGIASATILSIRLDPTSFYVNVHNAGFPDGAVRGQLH